MPQFASRWNMLRRYRNICLGLFIFSVGFFKKVVLADTFAGWATPGFDEKTELDFVEAWVTSLSYTFQLYFDFSGYTDMAIGASLLFNIRLPINFNSPYKALSIQDFWRRWHITLSNFLRDYLYIPLGGNRNGTALTYVNLFTTFLLGGLWHGASWMFVIWGALHGGALVIHRAWQQLGLRMPALLGWFITFNFVNFAWVFFRAKDLESAFKVLEGMFSVDTDALVDVAVRLQEYKFNSLADLLIPSSAASPLTVCLWLLGAFLLVLAFRNTSQYAAPARGVLFLQPLAYSALAAFALTVSLFSTYSEFIYFNF
jgi:D-alanyl-lipoteichoic acid acyltransferase DltB (MBOAT superfamily)